MSVPPSVTEAVQQHRVAVARQAAVTAKLYVLASALQCLVGVVAERQAAPLLGMAAVSVWAWILLWSPSAKLVAGKAKAQNEVEFGCHFTVIVFIMFFVGGLLSLHTTKTPLEGALAVAHIVASAAVVVAALGLRDQLRELRATQAAESDQRCEEIMSQEPRSGGQGNG